LSVHHLEGFVLRQGWTTEHFVHDYGYDLTLYTYDTNGEIEPGHILIQMKATDHPDWNASREYLSLPVERGVWEQWQGEAMPVILILFDAVTEEAYWLEVQSMEKEKKRDRQIYVTVRFSASDKITSQTMPMLRQLKEERLLNLKR
jgi:hypothetical protein